MKEKTRCLWATENKIYIDYHDVEWGVPIHSDNILFEYLILEGAQAGLNWLTILKKRAAYRKLYDNFDPRLVANYDEKKKLALLNDPNIIRNKLKIASSISNARAFLSIQAEFGSFKNYIWQFTEGKQIQNFFKTSENIPTKTILSDKISKDLKSRGFKFIGSTIIYAFMQAVGMVNDHLIDCFRHQEILNAENINK